MFASGLEGFVKEITLLNAAISQHLCGFYGVCWGENEYPGIVLEYVSNGSLELLLHGKNTHVADTSWTAPFAKLASDICRGLIYMHGEGIVHRDIKVRPPFPSSSDPSVLV